MDKFHKYNSFNVLSILFMKFASVYTALRKKYLLAKFCILFQNSGFLFALKFNMKCEQTELIVRKLCVYNPVQCHVMRAMLLLRRNIYI